MTQESTPKPLSRFGKLADYTFQHVEMFVYILLGLLLAIAAMLGVWNAAGMLYGAIQTNHDADALVIAIDRLLFVLMVVEILHTVRVSFRSGTLVCEPFLVVGLIASIRRVLIITLESSRVNPLEKWSPEAEAALRASMLELAVLGGLILVMVVSIYFIRRSHIDSDQEDEDGAKN